MHPFSLSEPSFEIFYQQIQSQPLWIYTDGACSGNPGPGGFGALLVSGDQCYEMSGGEYQTTNNRMEMQAAIEPIKMLYHHSFSQSVTVVTDSRYLKDGVTLWMPKWKINSWKTSNQKAVKNQDLWQELDTLVSQLPVTWEWVKGHQGHPENERADLLARQAIVAQRIQGKP
jgi:ribonuclease HI